MAKSKKITSNTTIDDKGLVKQVKNKPERNPDGTLKKGSTANPNGRPKSGLSIIERFRDHPDTQSIINKLYMVANTLDSDKPHKDAIASVKLIVERLIPSLKATEMKIDTDNETGFVFMPPQSKPEVDDE
tara:strand:+ start:537 stop:926 length:390 start_codon:yes stop_codon:yes gene_type:complete